MPTMDELTTRYQSVCQQLQDRKSVIEAFLEGCNGFKFNYVLEIPNLSKCEIDAKEEVVNNQIKSLTKRPENKKSPEADKRMT